MVSHVFYSIEYSGKLLHTELVRAKVCELLQVTFKSFMCRVKQPKQIKSLNGCLYFNFSSHAFTYILEETNHQN